MMEDLATVRRVRREAAPLVIGLVNNMAGMAMTATYEQFFAAFADTGRKFVLRHLTLRAGNDAPHGCTFIDGTLDGEIDALIVTGTEPKTEDLRDEWLWPRLTRLHDWCMLRRVPVLWSCLSAHVAVLHSNGIMRRRHDVKLSGVFACSAVAPYHPLLTGMPAQWRFPHSRYHGLPEEPLIAHGYAVISRAGPAGVDIFARTDGTPFYYFQGHPEYHADTLLKEYARDARRYVDGEQAKRPMVPCGLLAAADERLLAQLCDMKIEKRASKMLAVPYATQSKWQNTRRQLFMNWMDIVSPHPGNADRLLAGVADKQKIKVSTGASA